MSARARFLTEVEKMLGMPVLWGAKSGPATDCSGMVTRALKSIGGPDLTHIDNAQALHDATRPLGPNEAALPGDLCLYGLAGPADVVHVAVYDEFGGVISADGATSHITSLDVALADGHRRVRRHNTIKYRGDCQYIALHRFTHLDELDAVQR